MNRLELLETAKVAMDKAREARKLAVSAETSSTAVFINVARQYNPDGFDRSHRNHRGRGREYVRQRYRQSGTRSGQRL